MTKLFAMGGAALALALSTGLAGAECNWSKMTMASTAPKEPVEVASLAKPLPPTQPATEAPAEQATAAPATAAN